MLFTNSSKSKSPNLMGEYASLLGDALLRQRTREAEYKARVESELSARVKSEFVANMSHELRTPLNTMIGFSKILCEHDKRKLPDAEIVEYAQLINHAAVHLLAVINDILDISKIQSGRYSLDTREINVEEVLQSAVASIQHPLAEAGLTLEKRFARNLPVVRGDAAKLRQVFTNLLSNALKFTLPGGRIDIEAMRLEDDGLAVVIRDNGVGMTPEEVAIALTPFGQVDGSRTRWREGAGLGLTIAKALVELHGGQIKINSTKGQGTEVVVLFPSAERISVPEAREALFGGRTT